MKVNQIYVTLPVKNIQQTKEFWTKLGFSIYDKVADENAVCIVAKEDTIYIMFLTEETFQTFINKPVAKSDTCQVTVSLVMESREEVDRLVNAALENGGSQHEEPQDYGWMYHNSFWDINGHGWNITFADPSQMPAQ